MALFDSTNIIKLNRTTLIEVIGLDDTQMTTEVSSSDSTKISNEIEYTCNNLELIKLVQEDESLTPTLLSNYIISYYSNNIRVIDNKVQSKVVKESKLITIELYEFKCKVSTETTVKPNKSIDSNKIKECKVHRLTYSTPKLPHFKIDVSLRIFLKSKSIDYPDVDTYDIQNPSMMKNKDYDTKYDIEFECLDDNSNYLEELTEYIKSLTTQNNTFESIKDVNTTFRSNSKLFNNDNPLVKQAISETFDFKHCPNVGVVDNTWLEKVDFNKYVWLDKSDGVRYLLVMFKFHLFAYNTKSFKEVSQSQDYKDIFVVDTEYITETNEYLIFDAYYVNRDIRLSSYDSRMKRITDVLGKYQQFNNIKVKEYHEVSSSVSNEVVINQTDKSNSTNLKELFNYAMTEKQGVDGIIFQSKKPYSNWLKKLYQFKLKPLSLTTVDYYYHKTNKPNRYNLYLSGSTFELLLNVKSNVRTNKESYSGIKCNVFDTKLESTELKLDKIPSSKCLPILFDSPLFNNISYVDVTNDTYKSLAETVEDTKLKQQILSGNLDGLIIETKLINSRQIPYRVRVDKTKPNHYSIGLSCTSIIYSPPNLNNYQRYFHKITASTVEEVFDVRDGNKLLSDYHTLSQSIRKVAFDKLNDIIEPFNWKVNVLDLCCGRGGNISNLFNHFTQLKSITAIDSDKDALVGYMNKVLLQPRLTESKCQRINLNCIDATIGQDKIKDIIDKIKSRNDFHFTNVVVIDYALHYLCDFNWKTNFEDLITLLSNVCTKNYYVLVRFFDGEKILNQQFKTFEIKTVEKHDDYVIASMALPTIDVSGYRNEPLVLSHHIEYLKSKFNCVYDEMTSIEPNEDYNYISDYLNCIRTLILKNKDWKREMSD